MPWAQGSAGAAHVQDDAAGAGKRRTGCTVGRMPQAPGTGNVPDISGISSIRGGQAGWC
jgi:hypothetical protein